MYQPEPIYKLLDWIDKNKINWNWLSTNPNAIHLLGTNPEKINWEYLSENPNASHLLEKNPEIIDWNLLSANPSIFEIDYRTMKKQMVDIYLEELMKVVFHPKRISAWLDAGFEDV
jgi:hypothetical protein